MGGALSLPEMLVKIHTRTRVLKALEARQLEDEMAGQTDDTLGLSSLPMGLSYVLGITGKQLANGRGPRVDLEGLVARLHRPPALLSAPPEEVKRGPRKEYELDGCGLAVADDFDWSRSDLLICALDGDMDVVPLELTLLFKDIGGKEGEGDADRLRFIKALNLLLHLTNELRCPSVVHEVFWAAHAYNKPGTFVSIVLRLAALNTARCAVMALLRALMGRASPADRTLATNERETQLQERRLAQERLPQPLPPQASEASHSQHSLQSRPSSRASSAVGATRPRSFIIATDSRPQSAATVVSDSSALLAPQAFAPPKTAASKARLTHAHHIRAGAARAVQIAQRLHVGWAADAGAEGNYDGKAPEPPQSARAASPTRKERIAQMLAEMEREAGAGAGSEAAAVAAASEAVKGPVRGSFRRERNVMSSLRHLARASQSGPAGMASPESLSSASSAASPISTAATAAAIGLSTVTEGAGEQTAESEQRDLIQALVDAYARVLPWRVTQFVFADEIFVPSLSY